LESHAESTKSQLIDVLERCLQRDPRKRPSTNDLLAHPFLSAVAQVGRQQVEVAVASIMDRVTRLFGKALESPELANSLPSGGWQVLADEVWEQISRSEPGTTIYEKEHQDEKDARSLAPLSGITSRVSEMRHERDTAITENEKLIEHASRQKQRSAASQQLSQHQQHGHQQQRLQSQNATTTEQVKTSRGHPREEKVLARDKENATPANTNPTIQRLQAAKQRDLQSLDHSCQASRGIA